MDIKVTLTKKESEEIFHNILCNCIFTGWLNGYGLEVHYSREEYRETAEKLRDSKGNFSSIEDCILEMLRDGAPISFIDVEGDGVYSKKIFIKDIHERIQTADYQDLKDSLDGNGDVMTEDRILQTMLYGEIIFG